MKNKKNNTIKILSILLGISILANFLLFFSLGSTVLSYENEMRTNNFAWCELAEKQMRLSNDLIFLLRGIDPVYNELKLFEVSSCLDIIYGS